MLDLPFPVSTNALWQNGRGRTYLSRTYLKWKAEADALLMQSGQAKGAKKIFKDFSVAMVLDDSKFGKRDADNTVKSTLDYLQAIELIENDKFLKRLTVEWGKTKHGCRVTLEDAV